MLNSILTDPVTLPPLLICLVIAMILGVMTAMVFLYRSRHSVSFALTLALLPMTIAIVIMLVNGNIGTGVAVAGAFALVHFRSVPGTAREIAEIFTAMAINFGAASRYEKLLKIAIPENFNYEGLFDEVFEKYTEKVHLTKIRTTNMGTLFSLPMMWF